MSYRDPIEQLVEKAKSDQAFYRDLVKDPDKALNLMAKESGNKGLALKRVDAKKRTGTTKGAKKAPGGGVIGGGAGIFCFDATCGDESCQFTCGPRSCGFTCSLSCTGDTCKSSCGHTSGIVRRRKTS